MFYIQFKKKISEAKSKPRSKRKSLFLGFTTVLSIFGVTLLTPVLSAVAEEIPKKGPKGPKPADMAPATVPNNPALQPALVPSQQIVTSLSGAAASICALAISSGSFLLGGVCGIIVAVRILKAQGK